MSCRDGPENQCVWRGRDRVCKHSQAIKKLSLLLLKGFVIVDIAQHDTGLGALDLKYVDLLLWKLQL